VQTGPPALLCSQVRHLLLLRFIGLAAPRRQAAGGDGNNEDENYVYAILL